MIIQSISEKFGFYTLAAILVLVQSNTLTAADNLNVAVRNYTSGSYYVKVETDAINANGCFKNEGRCPDRTFIGRKIDNPYLHYQYGKRDVSSFYIDPCCYHAEVSIVNIVNGQTINDAVGCKNIFAYKDTTLEVTLGDGPPFCKSLGTICCTHK